MPSFRFRSVLSALGLLTVASSLPAQTYTIFPLDRGSFNDTQVFGISANGMITGSGYIAATGELDAIEYQNGVLQDLGTLGYPYGAYGYRINDSGQVAATGFGPGYNAVLYFDGQVTRLGTIDGGSSEGLAINSHGDIVGRAINGDGGGQGFQYVGGHFSVVNGASIATGINDADQVVGSIGYTWMQYGYLHQVSHAFLQTNGSITDLGDIGGGVRTNTEATAINNLGAVVGDSTAADGTVHAFMYDGQIHDLGTIAPYDTYAVSINDSGLVVGNIETYVGGQIGAFVSENGVLSNLQDLLDESGNGWSGLTVYQVNNEGWIIGYGTLNGVGRSFIAEPARALPVSGHVVLQNYAAAAVAGTPVTIELRDPGTTTPLESHVVNLDANGSFSFSTALAPGSYDVAAKGSHWLRRVIHGADLGAYGISGLQFSLINGDIDGNNAVTLGDFARLRLAYNSSPGAPNWNPDADLDGSGSVSLGDFAILRQNFGQSGNP